MDENIINYMNNIFLSKNLDLIDAYLNYIEVHKYQNKKQL